MFLRRTERKKNGKAHSYWNVVENKRLDDGRVVQRHVLYLGEINSSQAVCVYRKLKLRRSGGEGRQGWRVSGCFRFAEPDEKPVHLYPMTDAF